MNNLKKLLPLFAFVLGIGLVFSQSAFKAKTTMYGKTLVGTDVHWVPIDGLDPYNEPGPLPDGSYRCNPEETKTCLAEFSSPPSVNQIPSGLEIEGEFEANP